MISEREWIWSEILELLSQAHWIFNDRVRLLKTQRGTEQAFVMSPWTESCITFYQVQDGHIVYLHLSIAMKQSSLHKMLRSLRRKGLELFRIATRELTRTEILERGYTRRTPYDIREPWRVERAWVCVWNVAVLDACWGLCRGEARFENENKSHPLTPHVKHDLSFHLRREKTSLALWYQREWIWSEILELLSS